jgi:group I intron endonuclease
MPYADEIMGIYRIVNTVSKKAYVGQSVRVKKRVAEHFRLLRLGKHQNVHLQRSFDKHGADAFVWELEVECEDAADLDTLENTFLCGEAWFNEPLSYNIANEAKVPMRGKRHTEETRQRISRSKAGRREHVTEDYRQRLSSAQRKRWHEDPAFVAKVRFIVDNPHMSYAERGRVVGTDTSSARKLALQYTPLKEILPWLKLSSPDQCNLKTDLKP